MIFEYFKSPIIARNSGVVYFAQKVFFLKCKYSFNVYKVKKSSAKCEYYDENIFLKADKASSK